MNCKEFERAIPDFIEKKLDFLTLGTFLEHMEQCKACSEELSIQFLVMEGMQSLEDGDVFDLKNDLRIQLLEARRKIKFHKVCLWVGVVLEALAAAAAVVVVVRILW